MSSSAQILEIKAHRNIHRGAPANFLIANVSDEVIGKVDYAGGAADILGPAFISVTEVTSLDLKPGSGPWRAVVIGP